MIQIVLSLALAPLASGPLAAHDLWLLPPEKVEPKSPLTIRAASGTDFPLSLQAPDPAKFKRRLLLLPDGLEGAITAAGVEGKNGLLEFDAKGSGVHIVAVQTEPKLITLAADAFNHYLIADGLLHVYQLRRKEGVLDKAGRERYSKSPKALVQVGEGGGGDPCRIVGLPLEIVPLRSPFALKIGDTLEVRVLFQNEPLADANLGWDVPGDGEPPSGTVRTDKRGEARLPINQTGLMTIRLTHMTRPSKPEFEWESFWTTLTFRIQR